MLFPLRFVSVAATRRRSPGVFTSASGFLPGHSSREWTSVNSCANLTAFSLYTIMSKCSPLPQPSPPLIASYSISPSSPASCTTAPSSRDRLESLYGSPPSSPPSAPPPPSVLFDEGQEHPKLGTRRQCCEPSALLSREARGKRQAITRWIIVFISLSLALLLWAQLWIENGEDLIDAQKNAISGSPDIEALSLPRVPSARNDKYTAVRRWLRENSYNRYAFEWEADQRPLWRRLLLSNPYRLIYPISPRPKAAIISLVRNEELQGIMQSMRQLELRWNWKYRYPWIFFSETGFSEEFKVGNVKNPWPYLSLSTCASASTRHHFPSKPQLGVLQ